MVERYWIGTCPDMSWDYELPGGKRKSHRSAWLETELGMTATSMGLKPRGKRVLGPTSPEGKEKPYVEYYECLRVTDDEYMLLKLKHPKWFETWRIV